MISRKFFVYDEKHTCKRTRKSKHLSQISKLILALSAFRRQWANGTANYIILITKSNLKLILAPSALRSGVHSIEELGKHCVRLQAL